MLASIIFYLFSTVLIASAVMVVTVKNPVYSVLLLILCFFNAAGLFILMGAEFIAFVLVIVYVGAVAVLFLFVVMMLNTKREKMRHISRNELLAGLVVGLVLLIEICAAAFNWEAFKPLSIENTDNTQAIGKVLYTAYMYPFQVSGLILLVAMIGAITLTQRAKPKAKKQNITDQLNRKPEDEIKIMKIKIGEGSI